MCQTLYSVNYKGNLMSFTQLFFRGSNVIDSDYKSQREHLKDPYSYSQRNYCGVMASMSESWKPGRTYSFIQAAVSLLNDLLRVIDLYKFMQTRVRRRSWVLL